MTDLRIVVTGGAGFIGSNLVQSLLADHRVKIVRVIDNLSNGYYDNIEEFEDNSKFEFYNDDIRDFDRIVELTEGFDVISHQAALGSVPRSVENPMLTTEVNIDGTVNILYAAVKNAIKRVILACSSSTYGDSRELPKVEENIGNPLSPYAISKYTIELYAQVFKKTFDLDYVGLRYFNVFGPKQNPDNPYAAVIPIFCKSFIEDRKPIINGDGETSRDFTYVDNAVQANLKAIFTENKSALNEIYNVACGERTSLNNMIEILKKVTGKNIHPTYGPERLGDVKHSLADVSKINRLLGYVPNVLFAEGLEKVYKWYLKNLINE
ncbi:MAG: SDR family oxidoreductase [Bacteroidota bacterium]